MKSADFVDFEKGLDKDSRYIYKNNHSDVMMIAW